MSKTKIRNNFNGYGKWILWVVMAILAFGGMIERLHSHGTRLDKAEPKIETQGEAIIGVQSDIKHILKIQSEIKEGVNDLRGRK